MSILKRTSEGQWAKYQFMKIYEKPTLDVVKIEMESSLLLAGSIYGEDVDIENDSNPF